MVTTISDREALGTRESATAVDARPILPRSESNLWEQIELQRARLAKAFEEACREQGFDTMVLQSHPYVHPAWVKVECWIPREDPALTARSSATVTLTAVPFHRFETIYKVEWHKHGRDGVVDQVHTFEDEQARAITDFLCQAEAPRFRDRVRSILRPVQLRQRAWQLWKPINKVETVRRNRARIASQALIAVSVLMFMGAPLATVDAVNQAAPQAALPERTAGARPIWANLIQSSALDTFDPTTDGGTPFEMWSYLAAAGVPITVAMESDDLDAFVRVGQNAFGSWTTTAENDDFEGTRNARVTFVPATAGEYVILASAVGPRGQGSYTLSVAAAAEPQTETGAAASPTFSGLALLNFWLLPLAAGVIGLVATRRGPHLVRSAGKPMAEPRDLRYFDSWQTVVFGGGAGADDIRTWALAIFKGSQQTRFTCRVERIWYWGLDGKDEREQFVLQYKRAIVFVQIYQQGADLYVGWDAHMNVGTWIEQPFVSGIDRQTGERVRLMKVAHGSQPVTVHDLADLNCLAEWVHAQLTQIVRRHVKEQQIDQEIDFTIIRGDRKSVLADTAAAGKKKSRFSRKA